MSRPKPPTSLVPVLSLALLGACATGLSLGGHAAQGAGADAPAFEGLEWREVGPYRGGRSAAVCGVPSQPDTYYFGATGGGVWKTRDGGESWENVSDGFFGGSIGAVAVSEWDPNVVWVGTGEKTVRGNVSHGDGVWRSTDAGATWTHVGLPDTRHVPRIRVHPRDPDTAWVAALGHLYGPNEERGVFRTTDGGATWEQVLFVSPDAGCVDLALDPTNSRVLYASFWNVRRTPWSLSSGGEGSGLWKSVDGGDTWSELTGNPGLPDGTWGISGVSVSGADGRTVYCMVENEEGGLFRSDDGGETWRKTNEQRDLRQRAWYYTRVVADPLDVDTVYVLNVRFHRSKDGGRTFEAIGTPHGDNHDLWIAPDDPRRMVQSNDGGANVSTDGGASWTRQSNQPTAQMYRVSTDDAFPYRLLGGQQDNSAVRIRSRSLTSSSIGTRDWEPTAGGESGHVAATPGNPDVVFGGSYGGYLERRDHANGTSRAVDVWPEEAIGSGAEGLRYRFQWNFPLFFSPHDPTRLFAAANVLFESRDGGASWRALSEDLTRAAPETLGASGGPITKDNTGVEVYATIFAAFESPHEAGVLWCGSDDGLVHLSRDDGATWTDVTPPDLSEWSQVNGLDPHPTEPGGCYLVATRYKLDDFEPSLWRTTDWGATWTRIDAGIPRDHFTRALRADPARPGLLYAGTERGVYVSFDDGASWSSLQGDLPIVPITDLAVKEGDLVAATQGRGFWILDDLSPLHQHGDEADGLHLYAPRATPRVALRRSDDPHEAGTNPHPGVLFTYRLPEELADDAELTLVVHDAEGRILRTFTRRTPEGVEAEELPAWQQDDPRQLPAEPGLNRFAWDLRLASAEGFDDLVLWNSDLSGPRVLPGTYRAVLSLGDEQRAVDVEVVPDPRGLATLEELRAQHAFLLGTRDLLTRTHRGIRRLRTARASIEAVRERLESDSDEARAADALVEALTEVEEALYQTRNESPQDPLNFPVRLNDKLGRLHGQVGRGDFPPTAQAEALLRELTAAIEEHLDRLDGLLEDDLVELDRAVRALDLPLLTAD